jgi:CRISPR-associated protein Cas1
VAHLVGPGKIKIVNGRLAFATGAAGPVRLDPDALQMIFCHGEVGITDEAVQVLLGRRVHVAWLTPAGQACRGRLVGADPSTCALRLAQHQVLARPEHALTLARKVVAAKVASQAKAALHYYRHGCTAAGQAARDLAGLGAQAQAAPGLDVLRGLEGQASALWFAVLGRVLQPPWAFARRTRRPPTDPVNALLSLGYTLLLGRTQAVCEAVGLELYLGALHAYRPGRPSLACDLMEPLRVPAVDRWVVAVCHGKEVEPSEFEAVDGGGIHLQAAAYGRMLASWERQWQGEHEAHLEATVAEVVGWLRHLAPPLPTTEDGE